MSSKKNKVVVMENPDSGFDSNDLVSSTPMTDKKRRIVHFSDSEGSSESSNFAYFSPDLLTTPEFMFPVRKQFSQYCTESSLGFESKFKDNPKESSTDNPSFDVDCKESSSDDYATFDFSLSDNYTTTLEKLISKNMNTGKPHSCSKKDPTTPVNLNNLRYSTIDSSKHCEILRRNPFQSRKFSQVPLSSLIHENTISSSTSSNKSTLSLLSFLSSSDIDANLREKNYIDKSMSKDVVDRNATCSIETYRSNADSTAIDRSCLEIINPTTMSNKSFSESTVENVKESDVLDSLMLEYKNTPILYQSHNTMYRNPENKGNVYSISLFNDEATSDSSTIGNDNEENAFFRESNNADLDSRIEITCKRNETISKSFKNDSMQTSESFTEKFSRGQQNQEYSRKQRTCSEKELVFLQEENISGKYKEGMIVDRESRLSTPFTISATNSVNNVTIDGVMEIGKVGKDTELPKTPSGKQNREISEKDKMSCSEDKSQHSHAINLLEKCTEYRNTDIVSQTLVPKIIPEVNSTLPESSNTAVESMQLNNGFTENSTVLPKNMDRELNQIISNKEKSSCFFEKSDNSCEVLWKLAELPVIGASVNIMSTDRDSHSLSSKNISIANNNINTSSRENSYNEIQTIKGNNLALNGKGIHCISKPKVDIHILLDLFEVDNNVSKRIIVALSNELYGKGLTQTEMLKLLRKEAKSGTITKLKQNIAMFFKAALKAEIIERKNRSYYLKIETGKERVVSQTDQNKSKNKYDVSEKPRLFHIQKNKSKLKELTKEKKEKSTGISKKPSKKSHNTKRKRSVHRMQLRSSR